MLLLGIALIVVLNFIVSMTEAAILAVPLHRAKLLLKKTSRSQGAQALIHLKEASEEAITTLTSLSNLITVVGSVVVGAVAEETLGAHWVWLFAAVLTFVIMVSSEIIPKRIGEKYAESIALWSAPAIIVLSKVFRPLTFLVTKLLKSALRRDGKRRITRAEEIAYLASIGGMEGAIREYETRIIERVFKLADITAVDMMTPKPFVLMLDGDRTIGEAAHEIVACRYSKIPVYERSHDRIVGIARQSTLLKHLVEDEQGLQIKTLVEDPLIVPEGRIGDDLLKDFQEKKKSFAIVVDGRGHVSGIVTLRDVIEELVGETVGERDIAPELVKRVSKTEVLVHGQTQISFLNRFFNTNIPNHRNVNGFLLDEFGHLPKVGEVLKYDGVEIEIHEAGRSQIERVLIRKPE
ncbi:MAG: hemolysin family protein [Patescibacteria group bacterium]